MPTWNVIKACQLELLFRFFGLPPILPHYSRGNERPWRLPCKPDEPKTRLGCYNSLKLACFR